jgi:MFS family permease
MNAVVGRMTLISALQTAANGGVMSVLVVWVSQAFRMSATDSRIGLYYVAIAVSGVAAGKIASLATRAWSSNVAMKILVPLSLVLGYAMLLVPIWWVAAILLGLSSGLGLASVILAVTLRQQAIPDALQSRVNTLGRMLAFGLGYTVGAVIAGSLGQAIPIEAALAWVLLLRVAAAGVTYLPSRGSLTPADEVQVAH